MIGSILRSRFKVFIKYFGLIVFYPFLNKWVNEIVLTLFLDHKHSLFSQFSDSSKDGDSERMILDIRVLLLIKIKIWAILHSVQYLTIKFHRVFYALYNVENATQGSRSSNTCTTVDNYRSIIYDRVHICTLLANWCSRRYRF